MTGAAQTNPTGKRRIAFASYVPDNRLPGFLALLRSLALTNPGVCEDFVVLYDDLRPASVTAIRRLHPRIVLQRVDPVRYDEFAVSDPEHRPAPHAFVVLDFFRIRGYDTVITLDTDMVVLGSLGELLRMRAGLGAVPQSFQGQDGPNSGLLVIQGEHLTDEFCARLDTVGRCGEYKLDQQGHGVLTAALQGALTHIDSRFAFDRRRLADDLPVPDKVAVLQFPGVPKPWHGGEAGSAGTDAAWQRFQSADDAFFAEFLALGAAKHSDLLLHFGRQLVENGGGLDTAYRLAEAYMDGARYAEAAEVLSRFRIPVEDSRSHALLGSALMSGSRYDEAEAHLLLATADPVVAPRAFGGLAQIAWVRNDDTAAHRYALAGLDANPTDRMCRILYRRTLARDDKEPSPAAATEQIAHVAFYMDGQGNAGDKVLPETVRMCFDSDTGAQRWHPVHVHRLVDEAALEQINARRGLVIGGGGLFIPDTSPNGNSAWQWNVPDAMLQRVTVPLAVFAVGYNVFDGQSYTKRRFADSLRLLVERSSFFGLRNHGSVEKVRDLLPAELHDRVLFQPCPTTVTRLLTPGWQDPAQRDETVLVNCAYDRARLRFGHDYDHFLGEMASAIRALSRHAEIRYAAHAVGDEAFVFDLRREHGITLGVEPMYDYSNDRLREVYARTKLVIGMRGHAGMIPFGCGTPIISLISHPKMGYFLSDIGRPEWGVSVHDRNLGAVLTERALGLLDDHAAVVADVHQRQEMLWAVTRGNMAELEKYFEPAAA